MISKDFDINKFIALIDGVFDEIFIWDKDMRVIYANDACYRHYDLGPDFFIGKTQDELVNQYHMWAPALDISMFKSGKPLMQRQTAANGIEDVTISVPIFDEQGNLEYLIQSVRDCDSFLFKEVEPIIEDESFSEGGTLIYQDDAMKKLLHDIERAAKTTAPILILGETGVGKTFLARQIHNMSDRKDKPFISINMASLSPSVIESEFFGYESGAFTGANKEGRRGLFEAANGGTLFLDEIGEFPLDLQAKFLHVIQDGEFLQVGGTKPIQIDVRMLYATNTNLQRMVDSGQFRNDLYQRINMMEITVPPLRERPEDLKAMTAHFLATFNEKYNRALTLSDDVLDLFGKYTWKGNIRELSNVIERAVICCESNVCQIRDLPDSFFSMDNFREASSVETTAKVQASDLPGRKEAKAKDSSAREHAEPYALDMEQLRMKRVREAYRDHPTSRKLAKALGVSQSTANRWINKYIKNQ